MKKFMVVTMVEGNTCASFFATLNEAEDHRMNVVCGLGGIAQVYELMYHGDAVKDGGYGFYDFIYE